MDPFDDILPVAPAARARAGGRFIPKPKSKQLPQKEVSASHQVASSSNSLDTEGFSQNQCHNAVASSSEESIRHNLHPPVELPSFEDITNSKLGNSPQVNVNGDTTALVDALPLTITVSEVDAVWNFKNIPKSAHEADPVDFDVGPLTNIHPEINFNHVQPANAVENVSSNLADHSTVCPTISGGEESSENGEGSFLRGNKHLELIDNSLQGGLDLGVKSDSDHKVAMLESNVQSNFKFGREREVESAEFDMDPFSNILPDPGTRNAHKFQPKIKPRPRVDNAPAIASASSNVVMDSSVELPTSCTNKVQSFPTGSDGSGGLIQSTNLSLSTSEILKTTDLSNKFDNTCSSIPFSEDNRSLGAVVPSQLDSLNAMLSEVAVHNGARDWPSNFGKSAGETADIFSGLESLDDFLTQAATDVGKQALHSFNEKDTEANFVIPACSSANSFGVCDAAEAQRCPNYNAPQDSLTFNEAAVLNEDDTSSNNRSEREKVVDLNPACPIDDVFGYPSMKSGVDPTSEVPMHEELTNAANSPTLADVLHAEDVTAGKVDGDDGIVSSSLRERKRSSVAGKEDKGSKSLRQLRKRAASKPVTDTVNEDVEDDDDLDPPYNSNKDELEENGDEFQVDYSSKKKRASTSSNEKSVAKDGKPSQKHRRDNDLEKSTKEPPKKFSHSSRRRKRCLDKALLEIPEDELDPRTLPIKDIILLAEYRERLAKKEATTAKTSSINQSGGDSFHEAGANNEEEILGSEDGRDPGDDQTSEKIPSAPTLFNYQSFMDKEPRGKWSKQDTELFYEAVRQFGTDFSMIQQLFPGRTRHQVKLKYKKEERQHPLQLSDAVNNRAKDHSHFKLVIERLQQASPKAEQDPSRDVSDFMTGEEVEDLTPGTNEVVETNEQHAHVKDQEDSVAFHSPEQSDNSDDDFQRWSQYKSDY